MDTTENNTSLQVFDGPSTTAVDPAYQKYLSCAVNL